MAVPINLHPQYITNDNGEKVSVILSMKEFTSILEDVEDLTIVAERKHKKTSSHTSFIEELSENLYHENNKRN